MEWAKSSKTSMSVLQTNVDKGLRTRLKEVLSTGVAFDAWWVCVSDTGTMPQYLDLDSYIWYGYMRRNKFGGGVGTSSSTWDPYSMRDSHSKLI